MMLLSRTFSLARAKFWEPPGGSPPSSSSVPFAPATAKRLHGAGAELGISVLEVAISGSTVSAESGTLTLFGGGDAQVFEVAQPIFRAIAAQWFHMGPCGSGEAMKLVVNTLLGLGMQAIAEAIALLRH